MARASTGNIDVLALRNAYHGGTPGAMGLTSHHTWKYNVEYGGRVHHVMNPDPYRSPFAGSPEEIATQSVTDIREVIRYSTPGRIAAFIAEPINGVGGVTHGAPNYLREAYAVVREHGGLCISDEVQTGFGRTGEHFWGFQNWGVVPDIMTMAKGIGNGLPLAAVTTRMDVAKALTSRLHLNTFGGNPISCAAGLAVLEVIDAEGLQANAKAMGARLGRAHGVMTAPLVGDVRGMGLMLGVGWSRSATRRQTAATDSSREGDGVARPRRSTARAPISRLSASRRSTWITRSGARLAAPRKAGRSRRSRRVGARTGRPAGPGRLGPETVSGQARAPDFADARSAVG
jgi:alanine-glyoxylate transaminase/(R)-3-amino-2-methylpropionate-pyruvate transaminase